jgi:hypothetical protein
MSKDNEIKNLNHKRVCDISSDGRICTIKRDDCVTIITANPDKTFNFTHKRISAD